MTASAGTSHSPNGTSRMAPRQATAATDGRMSDSIGTPNQACDGCDLVVRTWSVPSSIAPSSAAATSQMTRRLEQPRQADDGDRHEREVAPGRAVVHRRDGTRRAHTRSGFAAAQASRSARDRVLSTSAGVTHARRAWLIPQRT